MSFWTRLGEAFKTPSAASPGSPDGIEFDSIETFSRALPFPMPSAWNGWPEDWNAGWSNGSILGLRKLIDTAWACLDTNSRVMSSFPVYRTRNEKIVTPKPWMINPDPLMYSCWNEFAKQMFWDYLMGETFVLSLAEGIDNMPIAMRVIPPWCVNVELVGGTRRYNIGSYDCTDEMLHIRYTSTTDDAHGHGPLEAAGARMTTAGLLQRYAGTLAETGGIPHYWIGVEQWLNKVEAEELLDTWVASRKRHLGEPGVIGGKGELHQTNSMSAKDMALLELAQFTEARIAVLLGVPPFLVALPTGADTLTYSTTESIFDYHDRSMLKPSASFVMAALSNWALADGEAVELNRDDYTRPNFADRMKAWADLVEKNIVSAEFVRKVERFDDQGGISAAAGLTGLTGMTDRAGTPIGGSNGYNLG